MMHRQAHCTRLTNNHLELSKPLLHFLFLLGTVHNLAHLISKLVQFELEQVIQLEACIQHKLNLEAKTSVYCNACESYVNAQAAFCRSTSSMPWPHALCSYIV